MKFGEITKTVPVTEIIAELQREIESSHFTEDPMHFTYAETWLHQRRWAKQTPGME